MFYSGSFDYLKLAGYLYFRGLKSANKPYKSLLAGYHGEQWVNQYLEGAIISNYSPALPGGNQAQFDFISPRSGKLYLFEVKNYEGVYIFSNDYFESQTGQRFANPIYQMMRAKGIIHSSLNYLHTQIKVESYLLFINPNFSLLNFPGDQRIILPGQVKKFLINHNKLALFEQDRELANKLVSIAKPSPLYRENYGHYNFDDLEKGLTCPNCFKLTIERFRQKCSCSNCNLSFTSHEILKYSMEELRLLFPDEKISVTRIYSWIKKIYSKDTIYRAIKTCNLDTK